MKCFVLLAFLLAAPGGASAQGCSLPEALTGQWDSSVADWTDLTITNTTVIALQTENVAYNFTCFLNNGTTYLLQSPELRVGDILVYHLYTCLDIVSEGANPDIVFFRIRTDPDHNNKPFKSIATNQDVTMESVCHQPATEMPMNYTFFLRKGFEDRLGNESCPRAFQAEFQANFTSDSPSDQQCTDGFTIDGCDHSHITFNYTDCDGDATNYTCLTSLMKDDVTYTIIVLQPTAQMHAGDFVYACLSQEAAVNGTLAITKSPGMCGALPAVDMEAQETKSCRNAEPETTTPSDTGSTSSNSSSNTSVTPPPSTNTTQGQGGGDGETGDGNSGNAASWGIMSFLLPLIAVARTALLP